MARGLPTLFATRSGETLGNNIANELTSLMQRRLYEFADIKKHAKEREEEARIERIKDFNERLFGDPAFHLRYSEISEFADGEIRVMIPNYRLEERGPVIINSVRGQDVFLIHSPKEAEQGRDIHANIIEGNIFGRTLSKWAEGVTLIQPYLPYSRQDHVMERETATARLLADITEISGFTHGMYLDLHADQISEFYAHVPDNLRASSLLLDTLKELVGYTHLHSSEIRVLAPDSGAAGRGRWYAKRLGTDLAFADKRRDYTTQNTIASTRIIGDIKDTIVMVIDDMIDTGGTMEKVVDAALQENAREVYLACSHALLSGNAVQRFDALYREHKIKKIVATDSITRSKTFSDRHPWYHEVSIAPMFAEAIYNLTMEGSVGNVYQGSRNIPSVGFD